MADEDPPLREVVRQHSSTLFRATSTTFSGGAVLLPPPTAEGQGPSETTPIRQTSRRRSVTQEQLQARLMQEVTEFLWARIHWIVLFIIAFIASVSVMIYFFIAALVGVLNFYNRPCDVPLKWYLLVVAVWSQIPSRLRPWLQERYNLHSPIEIICLSGLLAIPSWGIIGWGIFMVSSSKSCAKTNPGLFYPTEHFIIAQVVFTVLCLLLIAVSAFGLQHIVMLAARLQAKPGCTKAVKGLPRIEPDSRELIDDDDGRVLDCVICMDSLANKEREVVKAPCSHYFHEECLVTWCANHVDCPVCRQEIGPEDEPSEPV